MCCDVLANESFKVNKLIRHLKTNCDSLADRGKEIFKRKAKIVKKTRLDSSGSYQQKNAASVEASHLVTQKIVKVKKPHRTAEELILPCAKDVVSVMMGSYYYYLFTAIGFAPGGSGPYTTQLQQQKHTISTTKNIQ
jgi:hypothetical protein